MDNSAVHPERYALVEQMAKDQGVTVKQLVEDKSLQKKIDIKKYVTAEVGMPTLMDIMTELDKPGWILVVRWRSLSLKQVSSPLKICR